VATGSGAINLSGLTFSFATEAISPAIHANDGFISLGAAGEEARAQIDIYTGFTGPATFGSGGEFDTNLGSGSFVGIGRPFGIIVPLFYQSGAPLSGNATWNNATFASLGVTPGTYVWTWGTGANQNFTLKIPSLPDSSSSFGLFALGLIGLFSVGRFRSRQYA
jgi:hypothetical protein